MHEIGQNEEDEVFNVPSLVPSNLCNCYGSPVDLFQGVSSYFSQNSDEFYINPFLPMVTGLILEAAGLILDRNLDLLDLDPIKSWAGSSSSTSVRGEREALFSVKSISRKTSWNWFHGKTLSGERTSHIFLRHIFNLFT